MLLHLLKIALYAGFGLIGRPALVAGALVAAAAVLAALATPRLLALIDERLFARIGQIAMVAAGVAMFALSSRQIAALHDAWVDVVSPGGEHEVRLHWGGRQRLAAEAEPEGYVALERSIAFEALPPAVRAAALRLTPRVAVTLVEIVRSPRGTSYEIYFTRNGRPAKTELRITIRGVETF